ncbi:MAG TPA: hypothetical protein PK372_03040 [Rugosibacter sp.]|nr:hypothetical protein [Rugosibacter sp.]HQN45527.1 hypothetical protein [Rugosibacter sp.]HQQ34898.1 hypothetical protein [Rugosibacter sp.]
MFKEIVERQQAEFLAKQAALIEARGESFKNMIDGIPKLPGVRFGEPPYIVDDGEDALLLIDADGNYSRFPPDFYLSEASVNEDYDAIYSVPSLSTGLAIRLIPANNNYDFPEIQATLPESDEAYYEPLDELFELYINAVVDLTCQKVARELMRVRRSLMETCEGSDTVFADVLKTPGVSRAMFSIFGKSLADASEETVQNISGGEDEVEEDDNQS